MSEAFSIKAYLRGQIELGVTRFIADLRAIAESDRRASPGGIARSPYDLAFELAGGTRELAARLQGETVTPHSGFNFVPAPEEFCEIERAAGALEAAKGDFLAVWESIPEAAILEPLAGGKMTPLGIATVVNRHVHYHDAQLNYIQTLHGDGEIHWS